MNNTKRTATLNGRIMSKIAFCLILITLFITSSLFGQAYLDDGREIYDETVIVTLKSSYGSVNQRHELSIFSDIDIVSIKDLTEITGDIYDKKIDFKTFKQILAIKLAETDRESILKTVAKLKTFDFVEDAEPNYISELNLIPNDPYFSSGQLWGMTKIQAPQAWDISTGSSTVRIGIVDTGIRNHPDLDDNVVDGWDVHLNVPHNSAALQGAHGTHVAGTVGGIGNNNLGVVGVNWTVTLIPIRIDYNGQNCTTEAMVAAVTYGINNNIPILSMSFSSFGTNTSLRNAISNYFGLFVWSAGNNNQNLDSVINPPGSFNLPNLVSVGSTDVNDSKSSFSSYGATSVSIFAPGSDIWSTVFNNSYDSYNGTSMAAPHVSGAAAHLMSVNPSLTAAEIKTILVESGDTISINTGAGQQSVKRLNLNNAVNLVPRYDFDLRGAAISGPAVAYQFNTAIFNVIVVNSGFEVAENYSVRLMMDGYNTPLALTAGVTLQPNQSHTYTFGVTLTNSGPNQFYGETIWALDEFPANNKTPFHNIFVYPEGTLLVENFNSGTSLSAIGWGGSLNSSSGIKPGIGMGNSNAVELQVFNGSSVQNVYTPIINNPTGAAEVSFYYKILQPTSSTGFPLGASNAVNIEVSTTGPNGYYTPVYTINSSNHTTSNEFSYLNVPFTHSASPNINFRFNVLRADNNWRFILDDVLVASGNEIPSERPSNWGTPDAGTETNPFLISNLLNLKWLSEVSEDWWIDEDTLVHFKQTANINAISSLNWNDGAGFRPIGHRTSLTELPIFVGVYDGDGFSINNLYINIESEEGKFAGLFAHIKNNSILKNLELVDVDIYIESSNVATVAAGGFTGYADTNSTIINCHSTGNISSNGTSSSSGGIAGSISNSIIISCYSMCNINNSGISHSYSGGIVGSIVASSISKSYFDGNVNSTSINEYNVNSGGIAGWSMSAFISDCYTKGYINSDYASGGIVGWSIDETEISSNYSMANIVSNGTESCVGGIVGFNNSPALLFNNLWDTETTGQTLATCYETPPTNFGLSTFEMKQQENYFNAGWDFDDIWEHDLDKNYGYPYLQELPSVPISNRPRELSGEIEENNISLSWLPPLAGNTGTFDRYNLYRNGDLISTTTGLSHLDIELELDIIYEYYITALYTNPNGETASSNTISLIIESPPTFDPPTNLVATPGDTEIYLSWDQPEGLENGDWKMGNVELQVTSYKLQVDSSIGKNDKGKNSISTPNSQLPIPNSQFPTPNSQLSSSRSLSFYRIERWNGSPQGSWYQIHDTEDQSVLSWTDTNLLNGTTYYYRVIAVYIDPDGLSEPSNQVSATPLAPPANFNIDPETYNFGEINVAEISDLMVFTITNTGGSPLTINSIIKTGTNQDEFLLTNDDLPWIIDPQDIRVFSAAFAPTTPGEKTAFIEIIDDLESRNYMNYELKRSEIIKTSYNRDLHQVSLFGTANAVSITDETPLPTITSLIGNYPNPFNPETTIKFSLSVASNLKVDIYNVKGQLIKSLINEYKTPGTYYIIWKGTDDNGHQVSSGIYFYRMQTEDYISVKRMMMIK